MIVLLAALLATGTDWRVVALGLVVAWRPWLIVLVAVVWGVVTALRRRRGARVSPTVEVAFCNAVAAELRGGASLRIALMDAARRAPEIDLGAALRRLRAGVPIEHVAPDIERSLPANGALAGAAVRLVARTGARAADTFDALAERAAFGADVARERRTLTAQARLSAVVVGGGPLVFALFLLLTGRARTLWEHGAVGIGIGVAGMGLEILGLIVVVAVLRRGA